MPDTTKKISHRLRMRDIQYLKPKGYEKHLTITELSRAVDKDPSWIRKLERAKKIPVATRVKRGSLSIRLWSPAQVKEIKLILSKMKRGRPRLVK